MLQQAVQSISDLIKNTGFINLDFADVSAVMKDAGMAHMGVGRASGKNKAEEAARRAVSSPLLETSINGARGVLVNVTAPTRMTPTRRSSRSSTGSGKPSAPDPRSCTARCHWQRAVFGV